MYMKVYAPDGEMFEVPPALARSLVVSKGWATMPVVDVKPVLGQDIHLGEDRADESHANTVPVETPPADEHALHA